MRQKRCKNYFQIVCITFCLSSNFCLCFVLDKELMFIKSGSWFERTRVYVQCFPEQSQRFGICTFECLQCICADRTHRRYGFGFPCQCMLPSELLIAVRASEARVWWCSVQSGGVLYPLAYCQTTTQVFLGWEALKNEEYPHRGHEQWLKHLPHSESGMSRSSIFLQGKTFLGRRPSSLTLRCWTSITPRTVFQSRTRQSPRTVSAEVRVGTSSGIITMARFWMAPSLIPGKETTFPSPGQLSEVQLAPLTMG